MRNNRVCPPIAIGFWWSSSNSQENCRRSRSQMLLFVADACVTRFRTPGTVIEADGPIQHLCGLEVKSAQVSRASCWKTSSVPSAPVHWRSNISIRFLVRARIGPAWRRVDLARHAEGLLDEWPSPGGGLQRIAGGGRGALARVLQTRELNGVELTISDDHTGLRTALASWFASVPDLPMKNESRLWLLR
jgi:hypothetical protein